ncbi:MAG: TetR/AcrR family transcriptional regulator [Acidimicrobiales bacterium]
MPPGRGRPRDDTIDAAVLSVTRDHLARHGYEAMSVVGIAAEAGTTRQAIYRRWPSKGELAAAAVASLAEQTRRPPSDDPFADLVDELRDFARGVSRPGGLSMIGTMLQETTDPALVHSFRDLVVTPRRARLRTIVHRGVAAGLLDADADVDVAVAMLTGSWYARALSGEALPRRWPERAARLVWRALGGEPAG